MAENSGAVNSAVNSWNPSKLKLLRLIMEILRQQKRKSNIYHMLLTVSYS